jgi:CheY-like chemotaxis protein
MASAPDLTILMIEDDAGHARLIEKNLRRAGVTGRIVHLASGTATIDFLFGDGRDRPLMDRSLLVLLDLNLPDMTGFDILRRIKQHDGLKHWPVIVLTTTDDEADIRRCYELGCSVYIEKPLNDQNFGNAMGTLGLFWSVMQTSEPVKA